MMTLFGIPLSALFFLALYIKDKNAFAPPLSAAKEADCLRRIECGDKHARNELIEHNLRLVAHIAKKFAPYPPEQEDLISIGTIGLIKAADSFERKKDFRFSTYASKCITNEILMHFRSIRKCSSDVSLFDPVETESGSGSVQIIDTLMADFDLEDTVQLKLDVQRLYDALSSLDERSHRVILLRYGLAGNAPLTQSEIAAQLGISRSYVSRIEKAALEKLKGAL